MTLKEEVEHRLREAQKNKTFQDSEYRVPGSKKEMAAIRKLIQTYGTEKGLQMGEKEYGEVSMIKFVKKDEVFPEFDVKKQLDTGISSGATFLKLKLRGAYPGEPKIKTKESRLVYTGMANLLYTSFERISTVNSFNEKRLHIIQNMQMYVCKLLFSEDYVNLARNTLAVVANGADYRTEFVDFEDAYYYIETFIKEQLPKDKELVNTLSNFLTASGNIRIYDLRNLLHKSMLVDGLGILGASEEEKKAMTELIAAYKRAVFMSVVGDFDSWNFAKSPNHPFWLMALKSLPELRDRHNRPLDIYRRTYDGEDFSEFFFGVRFSNFLYSLTNSGTNYENFQKAKAYEGITEDKSIVEIEKCQAPKKAEIESSQDLLAKAIKSSSISDFELIMKEGTRIPAFYMSHYKKNGQIGNEWRYYFNLTDNADKEKYRILYIADLEKQIESKVDALEKCKIRYAPRPDDWSWAAEYLTEQINVDPETGKREKSKKRKIHDRPMLEYIERVGGLKIDKAKIEDRSHIEKFMTEVFGFQGYIFGISLKDSEAREIVYHFLGAIADFAEILNIDLTAINKKMGLNMGFASHGSGSARAHYEALGRIINLTKSHGDGSVAHEMAHYLDNIIPALDHIESYSYLQFATAQKNDRHGVKSDLKSPKVNDAFQQIMAYILYGKRKVSYNGSVSYSTGMGSYVEYVATAENAGVAYIRRVQKLENIEDAVWAYFGKTPFEDLTRNQLRVLDVVVRDAGVLEHTFRIPSKMSRFYQDSSRVGGEYWVRPLELFARAFEVYVADKLMQAGRKNNFLCHGEYESASEEYIQNYPYPQFEERKYLFDLFENLITQVKSAYGIGDFIPFTDEKNTAYKMEMHFVSNEEEVAKKQYAKKLKALVNLLSTKTKEIILGTGGDLRSAITELPEEDAAFAEKVLSIINLRKKLSEDHNKLQRGTRYDMPIEESRFKKELQDELNQLYNIPDWKERLTKMQKLATEIDNAQTMQALKEELLLVFANKIIESIEKGSFEEIYLYQLAIDTINSLSENELVNERSDLQPKDIFRFYRFYGIEEHVEAIMQKRDNRKKVNHETIKIVGDSIRDEYDKIQFDNFDLEKLLRDGNEYEQHKQFGFTSVQINEYGQPEYRTTEVEEIEFASKKNTATMVVSKDPNGKLYLGVRLGANNGGSIYGGWMDPKNPDKGRETKQQIYQDFYNEVKESNMWPEPIKNKLLQEIKHKLGLGETTKAFTYDKHGNIIEAEIISKGKNTTLVLLVSGHQTARANSEIFASKEDAKKRIEAEAPDKEAPGEATLTSAKLKSFYASLKGKVFIPKNKHDGGFPEVVIYRNGDVDDFVKIKKKPTITELKEIIDKYKAAEKLELRVWDDEYGGRETADHLIDHSLLIYEKSETKGRDLLKELSTGGMPYPSLDTGKVSIVSEKNLFGEEVTAKSKEAPKGSLVNIIPQVDLVRLGNSELVDLGNRRITSSRDSYALLKKIFPENKIGVQEYFYVLYLNRANDVIAYYNISKGGTTGTVVDIEMICNAAVQLLAKGVIVAHNHPTGHLKPSKADTLTTTNLKNALKTLEIDMLDHLILAPGGGYYSFADEGMI